MADKFTTISIFFLVSTILLYYGGLTAGMSNSLLDLLLDIEDTTSTVFWLKITGIVTLGGAVFVGILTKDTKTYIRGLYTIFYAGLLLTWLDVFRYLRDQIPLPLLIPSVGIIVILWFSSIVDYWTGVY